MKAQILSLFEGASEMDAGTMTAFGAIIFMVIALFILYLADE